MVNTVCDSTCEKAILIVSKTNDGFQLAPADLKLTESAVNGFLNEKGVMAFESLYQSVLHDEYVQPWLQGIEHLTVDHEGYIYWKGIDVEHYDYPYSDDSRQDLEALAQRCIHLESLGLTPTSTLAIWHWNRYKALTPEHPWLTFFTHSQGIWSDNSSLVIFSKSQVIHFIDDEAIKLNRSDDLHEFLEYRGVEYTPEDSFLTKMTKAGFEIPQVGQSKNESFMDTPLDNVIALLSKHGVLPTLFDEVH